MRRQRKYNYIYKTICDVTNKFYIGMNSTDNIDDGYLGSGKRLWYSLNKHGRDNHSIEILEYCDTREELKKREEEIVNENLLNEDLCMNLTTGGQGGILNEEHRKKLREGASKNQKKMWQDEEYRKKICKVLYDGMKKHHANRTIYNTFKGKKHSEDTKKKMSEAKKGKYKGENNSQYGTCWVTKNGENKKIIKKELNIFIQQGWGKGREMK